MYLNRQIKYPYLILLICHGILAMVAFKDFRLNPGEILFNNEGDGLKNYFTLLSYIKSDNNNLLLYNAFNYPFGEYIYTTDNTPLFALPFKWICRNIYDLSDYTLPIYNTFIILNLIVCGLLVFSLFRKLLHNDILSLIASIVLAWTNMQVVRIWRGHFNLSLSSFVLLAILLLYYWHRGGEHKKRLAATGVCMILLNVVSFFAHGYYIAIIGFFQAAMLFFLALCDRKLVHRKLSFLIAVIVPILSFAIVMLIMRATDGFFSLRKPGAGGYDWMEHKVRFWGLFTHYDFHSIHFPLRNMRGSIDPENMGYLGNIGLYTLLGMVVASIVSRSVKVEIKNTLRNFFAQPLLTAIFLGSLMMLVISFGEHYYTENLESGFLIYNILNPLYFVHQFTDMVEQFRDLGRFCWPFFWGFNLLMFYCLLSVLLRYGGRVRTGILAAVLFLGGCEVKDYVDAFQAKIAKDNPLSMNAGNFEDLKRLKIDFKKYQAILSLPYFHVGSESEYVVDDASAASTFTYKTQLYSHLPLINTKLSRTVLSQAIDLDSLVAYGRMTPELFAKFDDRPVIVMKYRNGPDHSLNNRPVADDIQRESWALPERYHLQPIDSTETWVFYEWFPKAVAN